MLFLWSLAQEGGRAIVIIAVIQSLCRDALLLLFAVLTLSSCVPTLRRCPPGWCRLGPLPLRLVGRCNCQRWGESWCFTMCSIVQPVFALVSIVAFWFLARLQHSGDPGRNLLVHCPGCCFVNNVWMVHGASWPRAAAHTDPIQATVCWESTGG